jgi:hypothetical protein
MVTYLVLIYLSLMVVLQSNISIELLMLEVLASRPAVTNEKNIRFPQLCKESSRIFPVPTMFFQITTH